MWFKGVSRRFGKCTCPSLETTSTFWARVTSSWDLAFVIKEPANRYWRAPKEHKVVYVLVIGLHQSHWLIHHGHCSARLGHWVAHHVHGVARLGHLPLWLLWQFVTVIARHGNGFGYLPGNSWRLLTWQLLTVIARHGNGFGYLPGNS